MLVELSNLDFTYGSTPVLEHINLAVPQGSILGLIGPNGGGKTTLVRLLMGLAKPTRGSIRIAGLSPRDAVRRGNLIGYLPQNPQRPEHFPIDVRQAITLGLAGKAGLLRGYAKDDLAHVEHLIDRIGLRDLQHEPIGNLSGGQLQRVLIARALAARPKLLIMDEPTTGIDARGQQAFIESMLALRSEMNLTIIFVSHDLRAVTSMADRIGCLNVTLHYHDVPEHLPADLVYRMFACDLEAIQRAPVEAVVPLTVSARKGEG